MKNITQLKEYYLNLSHTTRVRLGIGVAVVLFVIILFSALNERIASLDKKRKAREADLVEMMALKQRFLTAKMTSQRFAGRLASLRPDDSPGKVIEEIGIKGKSSLVTPLKGEERGGYLEDVAEVKLEGLTANEAINLLHQLETGARPVLVKKANVKTRYDDPARLDLTLTIALLKPLAQGQK